MTRFLYTLAVLALLPWAFLHLLWRARRQPGYLSHWGERLGCFRQRPAGPVIWLHAVSVGETRAAQPLVASLRKRYPKHRILFSHMTPTGRETSAALFGDTVDRVYLPYDAPWAVRRFLQHFRPEFGLIMETELWPNLIAACRQQGLPLLLVNARLSERSARRYRRFATLTREALAGLAAVAAQSEADAERFRRLGAREVAVLGNLKFDVTVADGQVALGRDFRQRIGGRPVFLAASTRAGEEAKLLEIWPKQTEALLVIVPRHPQRFTEVAALAADRGFTVQRRSEAGKVGAGTQVWLGDSMGELFAYYGAADAAFIGGSLLDYGSQNPIEACAAGTPLIIGPSTYNFVDAAAAALAAGAAVQIGDTEELVATALALLADPARRQVMGEAGRAFSEAQRGATARTLALIEAFSPAGC